mmetsp:Transcript_2387/g.8309  ORF Transcript_2387/g.8309 Transcript_2387/m.8309 type:complete len:366 (-) Transcript_2387:106-1203(-)
MLLLLAVHVLVRTHVGTRHLMPCRRVEVEGRGDDLPLPDVRARADARCEELRVVGAAPVLPIAAALGANHLIEAVPTKGRAGPPLGRIDGRAAATGRHPGRHHSALIQRSRRDVGEELVCARHVVRRGLAIGPRGEGLLGGGRGAGLGAGPRTHPAPHSGRDVVAGVRRGKREFSSPIRRLLKIVLPPEAVVRVVAVQERICGFFVHEGCTMVLAVQPCFDDPLGLGLSSKQCRKDREEEIKDENPPSKDRRPLELYLVLEEEVLCRLGKSSPHCCTHSPCTGCNLVAAESDQELAPLLGPVLDLHVPREHPGAGQELRCALASGQHERGYPLEPPAFLLPCLPLPPNLLLSGHHRVCRGRRHTG